MNSAEQDVVSILESIPDGVVTLDRDWRFTYVNAPAEQALGRPRAALLGKCVWEEYPHNLGTEVERQLRRAAAGRVACDYRGHDPTQDRWYDNRVYPMPDGGVAIYFRDVTDRRRAEERLRASEERFRRYFELGLIGMAITSPEKGVLEVNDEICRILGYTREELLQKTWAEMTHPDDLAADVAQFNRVLAGEIDSYTLDKRWVRKDGQVIDATISVKCLRRGDGSVDYFVALLQDVTERKRAEEALRRAHGEMETRVKERTAELDEANQALRGEVEARQRTEEALRQSEQHLVQELDAARRLHQVSTQLIQADNIQALFDQILDTVVAIMRADYASIQLLDPERGPGGELRLLGHRGFSDQAAQFWQWVRPTSQTTCGRALRTGQRVIVPDVETCDFMAGSADLVTYRRAGIRAMQTTPLLLRSGSILGMFSTHWRQPHEPAERELALLDILARQAADLLERHLAEAALRESEAQSRRLLDYQQAVMASMGEGLFTLDSQGLVTQMNPAAESLFGWKSAELLGRRLHDEIHYRHPDGGPFPLEDCVRFQALREGKVLKDHDGVFIRRDGSFFPVVLSASPLVSDGKVSGQVVVFRDVTDRKRAEERLRQSEARTQAILTSAADAIITIDYGGIIQSVNPAAERMFGYAAAEMVGQNVNLLMPSPHREAHDGYISRYLRTGEKHIIGINRETVGRRKDGSVFPVDLAVSEIPQLKHFTGIHRDLTERKQLERELVEVVSQTQQRIGQDLHDSVAQELSALNLLAGTLAQTLETNPANAAKFVERLEQGFQRIQQELRAVLRGLLPVEVDSRGLMAALTGLAHRTHREGQVTCTFDCPEPVAVADNLTATHLYLVAQEAVHNAVKHGQPRNIRISLESNHLLVLRVQDDGIGMPAQPVANRGLGLRIMHNRAAIIGATLTSEPAEPTGTVVTCALARMKNDNYQNTESSQGSDRR
jgi:PAS domain S-box-containing protein